MAHPQGARGMQNAASNALQLAATRYTAGTAPFSGGGVASGAQAEVVDLTGSFPKEAAKQQPAKRRRPASGEHPFQALDDSEAGAPLPQLILISGSDGRYAKNQPMLVQLVEEKLLCVCVLRMKDGVVGAVVGEEKDKENVQVLLYVESCGQAGEEPTIRTVAQVLGPPPASAAGSGGGRGPQRSSYSGRSTPASGGRDGGRGGWHGDRGYIYTPPPPPAAAWTPASAPHVYGGGSAARAGGGGARQTGGVGGSAASGAVTVKFAARADFERIACDHYVAVNSCCPECDAELRVWALGTVAQRPGYIVRGMVGGLASNRRCCGSIDTVVVLHWVLQNSDWSC